MKQTLKFKILNFIHSVGTSGVQLKEISAKFNKFNNNQKLEKILHNLLIDGHILKKNEKFFSSDKLNLIKAQITKNVKNYFFAKTLDGHHNFFIPAKFANNAMTDDSVLLTKLPKKFVKKNKKNKLEECQVITIIKKNNIIKFTGTIILIHNKTYVKPDEKLNFLLDIENANNFKKLKQNYKVVAKIDRTTFNSDKPSCKILKIYGDSNRAEFCAMAYLKNCNVPINFNKLVLQETQNLKLSKKLQLESQKDRLDLTKEIIFTIDGKNSKDLDDAVSIKKIEQNYLIGVHIADVSHFVKFKSKTDKQALKRSNSIYFANKVIPMLCEDLSNDICSLQPNKIRLTFSVMITLNSNCKIVEFKIKKTKIKSTIKGVYEEINKIFEKNCNKKTKIKLLKKYEKIMPQLEILKKICLQLKKNREKNGAANLQTSECEIELNKNNEVTNIIAKQQLIAETIIEELMLLANVCVAKFAKQHKLPILFRVHEKPSLEKINNFKNLLQNLGLNTTKIKPDIKLKTLSELLKKHQNSKIFTIINNSILKTMSKAKYSNKILQHFGLNFKTYTHFTSPIRRYSDLYVHRILTAYLYENKNPQELTQKFKNYSEKTLKKINSTEITTLKIERNCNDYYKAEFMQNKIGQKFDAIISGCTNFGLFVQLPNTIEGLVKIETLDGNFKFDGFCKLICKNNKNNNYTIGQKVKVICTSVNVNSKSIDFEILKK